MASGAPIRKPSPAAIRPARGEAAAQHVGDESAGQRPRDAAQQPPLAEQQRDLAHREAEGPRHAGSAPTHQPVHPERNQCPADEDVDQRRGPEDDVEGGGHFLSIARLEAAGTRILRQRRRRRDCRTQCTMLTARPRAQAMAKAAVSAAEQCRTADRETRRPAHRPRCRRAAGPASAKHAAHPHLQLPEQLAQRERQRRPARIVEAPGQEGQAEPRQPHAPSSRSASRTPPGASRRPGSPARRPGRCPTVDPHGEGAALGEVVGHQRSAAAAAAAAPMPIAARVRKSETNPCDSPARQAKTLQSAMPRVSTTRRERRSESTPKGSTARE